MIYSEYKNAAEQHLETCFSIVNQLEEFEIKKQRGGISNSETKTQTNLLASLYYLSGYMIECLYNYAICKKGLVPNTIPVKHLDRSPSVGGTGTYGTLPICFSYNKKNTSNIRYCLYRKGHKMTLSDLAFLDIYANSENIPLLHNNAHFSDPNIAFLFDNWSAYERYKLNYENVVIFPSGIASPFTYKAIIKLFWELVDVCAKMSQHILREVTLFRKIIKKRPSTI